MKNIIYFVLFFALGIALTQYVSWSAVLSSWLSIYCSGRHFGNFIADSLS